MKKSCAEHLKSYQSAIVLRKTKFGFDRKDYRLSIVLKSDRKTVKMTANSGELDWIGDINSDKIEKPKRVRFSRLIANREIFVRFDSAVEQ